MKDLRLYLQAGDTNQVSLLASLETSLLMDLVVAACIHVQRYIDPQSRDYVEPQEFLGQAFDGIAKDIARRNSLPTFRGIDGQSILISIEAQVTLISEYVTLRNSVADNFWYVGEEFWKIQLVYFTVKRNHNWTVALIEEVHRKRGKDFGSGLGYQKVNTFKPVRHWPDKYEFSDNTQPAELLPCERARLTSE